MFCIVHSLLCAPGGLRRHSTIHSADIHGQTVRCTAAADSAAAPCATHSLPAPVPVLVCATVARLRTALVGLAAPASVLLGTLAKQLQQLVMLKAGIGDCNLSAAELQRLMPGAPESWALGQRSARAVGSVTTTWRLDVGTLRSTAQLSATQQTPLTLRSPCATPPLGGVELGIMIQAVWQAEKQDSVIGVYAEPRNVPDESYYKFEFELGVIACQHKTDVPAATGSGTVTATGTPTSGWGWLDFFKAGPMAGAGMLRPGPAKDCPQRGI